MMQSKPTLDTILSHRSIRRFTSEPIAAEILDTLVRAGQQASTSNNLQCVSIIRVSDLALRQGYMKRQEAHLILSIVRNFYCFASIFPNTRQCFPMRKLIGRK